MRLLSWIDLLLAGSLWLGGLLLFRSALVRVHGRGGRGLRGFRQDPAALGVSVLAAVMVATAVAVLGLSLGLGMLLG